MPALSSSKTNSSRPSVRVLLAYFPYFPLVPAHNEHNSICSGPINELSLANISQTRILSAAISVQSSRDFRVNLVVVRIDWELVMMSRDGDFVADDGDDKVGDFTTSFLGAVGLELYG